MVSYNRRLNVLGFIGLSGRCHVTYQTGKVTSEVVIQAFDDFVKEEKSDKWCIVVLDNARIHKSKAFKKAAKKWRKQKIILIYLPTYSPELT